jgi:hypothetical protein
VLRPTCAITLILSLSSLALAADMEWRKDIREALEEAEGRGVPLLAYLTRDE